MARRAADVHTVTERAGQVRFTYRLRVSAASERLLLAEWGRCRWVWNECVARSRKAHQEGETCGPARLYKMLTGARSVTPWLREGSSVAQQQTVRDFGTSRAKALKDIKDRLPIRRRAGLPRPKKKDEAALTLNYTRSGFRLREGRLCVAGGIRVSVVWSRPLAAEPSSVRLYRDELGHWYASFVVPARTEALPRTGRVLGVDWGVREIATTTSDRHDLPHPEHGRKAAAGLTHHQRTAAGRRRASGRPGSKGYRRARRRAARQHKKIARRRADTARKWAKAVVRDHDEIAVEDFRPRFLARTGMARKAADAAIGVTKRALLEMARKHGRIVHLVHPAYTTRDCARCGARAKHALPLGERTYHCTTCGASSPRDKNSARLMLVRAGLNPAGSDRVRPDRPPDGQAA
ncbi:RNA-guided endonuclease InsQ/TnpB family protein [Streptomyces sp. NPDC002067]